MTTAWQNRINWENVGKGVQQYIEIMKMYPQIEYDWNNDKFQVFKRKFNHFYRLRRNEEFQKVYYGLLFEYRGRPDITFEEILETLHYKTKRTEASFSSKMMATINPKFPVWDSEVLMKLNLAAPKVNVPNRIKKVVDLYDDIKMWYAKEVYSDLGKEMLIVFNKKFNDPDITDIKKRDLMEWQKDR